MFHYIHQLVTNFVCLLFGAGLGAYSWFLELFKLKTAARCSQKQAMRAGTFHITHNHLIHRYYKKYW